MNNCIFCSGRIRNLVAMTTYIFHRLITGKVEIDNIFLSNGDIWKKNTDMFIEYGSPLCFIRVLFKSLNSICCQGDKKGLLAHLSQRLTR